MGKYLYNGVELPALPAWDKKTYPYAVIVYNAFLINPYVLRVCASLFDVFTSGDSTFLGGTVDEALSMYSKYDSDSDAWGEFTSGTWGTSNSSAAPIWTNTDVYIREDGTLYLAASEPIPVGATPDIDPTSMLMGWLTGRRIAGQRTADGSAVWAFMAGNTLILRAADSAVQTDDTLEVR